MSLVTMFVTGDSRWHCLGCVDCPFNGSYGEFVCKQHHVDKTHWSLVALILGHFAQMRDLFSINFDLFTESIKTVWQLVTLCEKGRTPHFILRFLFYYSAVLYAIVYMLLIIMHLHNLKTDEKVKQRYNFDYPTTDWITLIFSRVLSTTCIAMFVYNVKLENEWMWQHKWVPWVWHALGRANDQKVVMIHSLSGSGCGHPNYRCVSMADIT
jgi:hypothetical protein